ncbi:hypothetical protein MMB75_05505 [Paenibacillus sp. P2(2022)]|uniref:hypothetical protein n=1 Tax=Paenibacillus TaxID=44249 RepID=UPI0005ECFFD9|nr:MULTISPECIES: hypothetical protein [Paenibacillus]AUS27049.1 hypothetical protein C1A50_2882 [Paenibacillus polymyxa]KJK30791.1 hypothetical protein TY89_11545 [Paenibacillus polymyxa]MDG0053130.1 hypothetical protein [Paenibacillus sp. P2(2022)]WOZ36415.1 hypothetical protein RQP19_13580 [Paenibacillus polymyxa]
MRYFWNAFKYLFTVSATPVSLLLLLIFNIRPFKKILEITGWTLNATNVETTTAAIDLAILVLLYNILGKVFSKFKKPVSIKFSIEDPKDPEGDLTVKYDSSTGLKKMKIKVSVDYKNNFLKFLSRLGSEHYIEVHWNNWFTFEIDEEISNSIGGATSVNKWSAPISLGNYDYQAKFDIPFYFTINNTLRRNGSIVPELRFHSNFVLNYVMILLTYMWIDKKEQKIDVILLRE